MSYFELADPSKYCMAHNMVDQVTGCRVENIMIASGMVGVQMLGRGELDIGILGSTPTTLALSAPLHLDIEVLHR